MNFSVEDDKPQARPGTLAFWAVTGPLRYVWAALIVHALAGWAFYQIGPRQHEIKRHERQLASTARMTAQVRSEQRVQDLAQIKQLLEQSRSGAKVTAAAPPPPEQVQFSATSLPQTPDQLLTQARELAESIDRIDKDNQAEELARVLKITQEEARTRLAGEQAAAPPTPPPPPAQDKDDTASAPDTASNSTPEDAVAGEIAQLEIKALDALKRRRDQLAREGGGVMVEAADTGTGARQQHPQGQGRAQGNGHGDGQAQATAQGTGELQRYIDAFMSRRIIQTASTRDGAADVKVADRGAAPIPPLPPGTMHKGAGRMLGSGGEYATRVHLNSWYVIGPFEGSMSGGVYAAPVYPPERSVMFDAVYRGKEQRMLRWRYVTGAAYPFVPPDFEEGAVYYGYTELLSDRTQDVEMWVGADDDAKVWVNDKLVWAKGDYNKVAFFTLAYRDASLGRDLNISEGKRTIRLNQGRNKFFFKLSNGRQHGFLSIVLTRKM